MMKQLNKKSVLGVTAFNLLVFHTGCASNSNLSELQRSAAGGNAQAQYELGFKYEAGIDVARNLDTALGLYRQAAQQGNVSAKNNLARLGSTAQPKNAAQPSSAIQPQDFGTSANNHLATDSLPVRIEPNNADDSRKSHAIPGDQFVNAEIDEGFTRWSSAWIRDQYIPNSARVNDQGVKDASYLYRGSFGFVRGGSTHTIPFSATFTQSSHGYQLVQLCYNDHTTGMTDCIEPTNERIAATMKQSRQIMGAIALLGVAAALSAPDSDYSSEDSVSTNNRLRDLSEDAEARREQERKDTIEEKMLEQRWESSHTPDALGHGTPIE